MPVCVLDFVEVLLAVVAVVEVVVIAMLVSVPFTYRSRLQGTQVTEGRGKR